MNNVCQYQFEYGLSLHYPRYHQKVSQSVKNNNILFKKKKTFLYF